ncbi:MAG: VanZ family protein [Lachnospiraceae bacterium]
MNYFALFLKKTLRYLLKPLSFLPALMMMYVIYSLSAQTGEVSGTLSYETSKTLVLAYNRILSRGYSNDILNLLIVQIHPLIRKLAHVGVYFGLAVTISFPLYVYRIRGFFLFITGGVFCVLFAFFDEYHQSFVAGRGPSLRDVGIDSIGILLGLIAAELICFIGRKTLFKPLSLESYRRKRKVYEEKLQEDSSID